MTTEGALKNSGLLEGRRWASVLAVLGLILASACADPPSGQAGQARGGPGSRRGGGRPPEGTVVPVETGLAQRGTIERTVTVSGTVSPIRNVGVNSQLSGALLSVDVEESDRVAEDRVMARLDDREIRAQLQSAEAGLEVARSTFERSQRLRERQVITDAEFERDRAALAAAQAQTDQLRTRLDFATVRAPVTGLVTEKRVESGDIVAPQTHLFTIADVSTMVVRVDVSELDVVRLSPGQVVTVALDAYRGRRYGGHIRRVFPAADPTTRLVPVEVALDAAAALDARPGFLARVTFALERREDVLQIPTSAIVRRADGEAVYVVNGDRAGIRPVSLGVTSEGLVEVRSGIEEGDEIVVVGTNQLRDGAEIRRVERPGQTRDTSVSSAGVAAGEVLGGAP